MSLRKVVITVSANNLSQVINSLELDQEFCKNAKYTVEVGLKDTKKNYEFLCQSDLIDSWDFVENKEDSFDLLDEDSNIKGIVNSIIPYLINVSPFLYRRLLNLFLVMWEVKKKSPALRLTEEIFKPYITDNNILCYKSHYNQETFKNLNTLLEDFYNKEFGFIHCLSDLVLRMKSSWKKLEDFNNPIEALEYLLQD